MRSRFEEAFRAVWAGRAESDGFNALVLIAGLTARQVVILRTVAKYLRQSASTFSQDYVQSALVAHTEIARSLVELFEARFDPDLFPTRRPARTSARPGPSGSSHGSTRRWTTWRASTTTGSSVPSSASSAPACGRTSTR